MRKLKSVCLTAAAALLFSALPCFNIRSFALESWADDCYVASEGACLMDADSGVILFAKNADTPYYPASITKVLTALLTIENCGSLSEQVTFSYDAVHIEEENATIIGASEGDRLSVLDCLYSLLFQSANEVANALAEHVGAKHPELKEEGMDDRDVFVRMMNDRAEELGCTGSHFNNPSGLTDEEHYTTAHDMCLILSAAVKNETFLDIESHTYWTHAPIKRYPDADDPWNTVYPKHLMLKKNSAQYYSGAIAGKTGYTVNAGNTLVTACEREGMRLVCCVLNAHANHYNDTRRLMDFGYDNFTSVRVTDYDDINASVSRDFSIGGISLVDSLTLGIEPDTRITIPKNGSYVEVKKRLNTVNTASGELAGLEFTYGERVVGRTGIRLIDINENNELYRAAGSDPLLAEAFGVDPAAGSESAEDVSDPENTVWAGDVSGSSDTGSAEDASVTSGTGSAEDVSDPTDNASAEDASGAADAVLSEAASDTGNAERPEVSSGTEDSDSPGAPGESASSASAPPGAAAESTSPAARGAASESASPGGSDAGFVGNLRKTLSKVYNSGIFKTILKLMPVVLAALIIFIAARAVIEKKNAKRRAERRAERMRRNEDLSGSQQIKMDLEMQKKRRQSRRRK